ncbi:MAG TPA: chemotaxis protein CheB [Polyangiaceae bacterium]|nr:chemotaxis protein CheB [Polyangiaceae bacterium]
MPTRDIVVIGASAGGVEALMQLVSDLPADFGGSIFLVLHYPPQSTSALPKILSRAGSLVACHAEDHMPIEPGKIVIAPPDYHLLVEPGHVHIVHGPKENSFRPSIDSLFRSAALAYGPRVIGVILTGLLDDGTAGLLAVKRRGGLAIVQDPEDALFDGMPKSAISYVNVDHVAPLAAIPSLLTRLVKEPTKTLDEDQAMGNEDTKLKLERGVDALDKDAMQSVQKFGTPAPFSCPDCGGVLSELYDGALIRFRCQVGHAYSPESVLSCHASALERALYQSFNMLNERVTLMERLKADAAARNDPRASRRFAAEMEAIEAQKSLVRDVLDKCSVAKPASEREPESKRDRSAPAARAAR